MTSKVTYEVERVSSKINLLSHLVTRVVIRVKALFNWNKVGQQVARKYYPYYKMPFTLIECLNNNFQAYKNYLLFFSFFPVLIAYTVNPQIRQFVVVVAAAGGGGKIK